MLKPLIGQDLVDPPQRRKRLGQHRPGQRSVVPGSSSRKPFPDTVNTP